MASTHSNSLTVVRQTELAMPTVDPKAVEQALMLGDLSKMTPDMRVQYYVGACQSIGLNPYTKPFDAIKGDDGAVSLYANKGCAEQLRRLYNVSLRTLSRERLDGLYIVTVLASLPNGREEEAIGAVPLEEPRGQWRTTQNGKRYFEQAKATNGAPIFDPLHGTALANALKKAETQAKRRATLGICGLGFADAESAGGEPVEFDTERGTFEAERLAPLVEAEQQKSLQEHVADLWGDPPASQGKAATEAGQPEDFDENPAEDEIPREQAFTSSSIYTDTAVSLAVLPPEPPDDQWLTEMQEALTTLHTMAEAGNDRVVPIVAKLEKALDDPLALRPAQRTVLGHAVQQALVPQESDIPF